MADRVGVSMAQRTCSIDGCDRPHDSRAMCKNHAQLARYYANQEAAKATQAEYRSARREQERARVAVWREANAERAREARRQWYAENRDKVREYRRRYRETNRDSIRTANNRRKALHRGAEVNDLTGAEWTAIKAAYGQRCAYCHTKPKRLTQDHVIPLAKGGHHTASNVVPACQPCNSRKGDREAPTYQPLLM